MHIFNPFAGKNYCETVVLVSALLLCLAAVFIYRSNLSSSNSILTSTDKKELIGKFFKMPLNFEVNQGQFDSQVKYLTRGQKYNLFFTADALVFTFSQTAVLSAGFVGANANVDVVGNDKLITKSNYFLGDDSKKWHTNIPNYGKVEYKNLYPGIDAVFYGNKQQLEYDIHVAPNADPQNFRLHFQGAQNISVNKQGDLVLNVAPKQSVSMHKPVIYQVVSGTKQNIEGSFVLLANNEIGFKLGAYDKSKELVIDPVLYYSTYLTTNTGATGDTSYGNNIAVDSNGLIYITGYTTSANFPIYKNLTLYVPCTLAGTAFVAKIDPSQTTRANQLIFSTYLGPQSGQCSTVDNKHGTAALGIAIDSSSNIYVAGNDASRYFPTLNGYPAPSVID